MRALMSNQGLRLVLALALVIATTALLGLLQHLLVAANLVLCYVPIVVLIAIRLGRTSAVAASFTAFMTYNFFFVPPLYTFAVERLQDVIELFVFLAISLVVGTLAARERVLAAAAQQRAEHMTTLYQLSRAVSAATDIDHVLTTVALTLQKVFRATGVKIQIAAQQEHAAHTATVGVCACEPSITQPIATETQTLGELHIWTDDAMLPDTRELATLLTTVANHTALAVERRRTMNVVLHSTALREADRLKSALLSSVSHDLRTPLAVIKGAASNLMDDSITWDAATQRMFAATIVSEADRLNRLMRNLLEMSRLEAGTVRRQHTLVDVADVIGPTVTRLRSLLDEHQIMVQIAPDLPPAPMDPVQIELVLSNLLENAAKFAPKHTEITLSANATHNGILITIADRGPGVPLADRTKIFDKFYRRAAPEQGPGGTGLGLAICQGIIEAHGGQIWVDEHVGGGASFRFLLPAPARLPGAKPVPALMGEA